MKMLKIVVSLLIIYFLICIKYYFRYNFPEIVQIPNGLEKRDIKYYFDDNARNIVVSKYPSTITDDNITFIDTKKLILITNDIDNKKIKMPGDVFLQLYHDNSQQEEFHNYYYSGSYHVPSKIKYFLDYQYFIKSFLLILPEKTHLELCQHLSSTFIWMNKGSANLIIFPYSEENKKVLKGAKFWKNQNKLQGSSYLEIKLSKDTLVKIPPLCWYSLEIISPSLIFKSYHSM